MVMITGLNILSLLRDPRCCAGDAAIRIQHGCNQRARGQHRVLHEGRVQVPLR